MSADRMLSGKHWGIVYPAHCGLSTENHGATTVPQGLPSFWLIFVDQLPTFEDLTLFTLYFFSLGPYIEIPGNSLIFDHSIN